MWLAEAVFTDMDGTEFLKFRDLVITHGWDKCRVRNAYWVGNVERMPADDSIYRVTISPVTGHITVACIGLESVDAVIDGNYNNIDELPDWMQEKLTLLSMLRHEPPTEPVDGVGQRINEDIFWVFRC